MDAQLTFGAAGGSFRAGDFTVIGTEHAPNLTLRMHDHEAATIVVVQRGEFEERVGSRSFRCTPGSILIKPAGAHHSNHYGGAGSTAILAALPDGWSVSDVALFRDAAAMQRLAFELRACDAASSLVCEGLLIELLQHRPGCVDEAPRRPAPAWLRSAEERLRSEAPAGMGALAAEVGRDAVHLAREFRRYYGRSPGDYARSARIERACGMLRRSSDSIASIALAAGFYDQSHFTNVFRRIVGMTPAAYRRRAGA